MRSMVERFVGAGASDEAKPTTDLDGDIGHVLPPSPAR